MFFARTFASMFRNKKQQPIRLARKQPRNAAKLHVEQLEERLVPANFTAGNLAVIDLAAASTNTTASVLELSPSTANQANPVQTVSIPSTGTNALRFSNSGTSSFLAHSNDNTQLTIGGYNTTDSSTADLANTTTTDRAVVTLDNTTTINIPTTYTGISGNQDRSATTTDDVHYYITDKGGLYSNGETAPTDTLNILVAKSFGGTAYIATTRTAAQGDTFGSAILTAASPTATTFTGLSSNIPIDTAIQDFYLIQSGNNGTTYDTLYTLDGATGAINKFSLTSGTWTARGTYTPPTGDLLHGGGLSLAAEPNGSGGAYLFATTEIVVSSKDVVGNSVEQLTDTAAYNANISVTTANNVTLFTATGASAGELKGIDFVPVASSGTVTTTDAPTVSPAGSQAYGTSETFTAVVHASTGSAAPTAGIVTFSSGGTVLATATAETTSGTAATFTVSSTTVPVGSYSNITAVYSPGAGFVGSTSSASSSTLTITGTATTAAAPTFTPATVTVNTPVSFSDVVTASSGSTAPTAGTVTFMNGSTVLATASTETTSGTQATFTVTSNTIPVGTYSNITAVYSANGAFTGSTSSASGSTLTVNPVQAPSGAIAQWTFENDPIALNNNPAPSTGTGTASAIGMTNSFNGTTSTNTDDVLQGVSGDTGTNTLADTTQIWRVRGQTPGNGWSSQALIGTQGAEFATSTVNYTGPITVTFDWYATTAGEANLQLEYTTDGSTWHNAPITVPSGDADVAALTNSSSPNTVTGSYVQMSGGQQWAPGLTAVISDPAAVNDPNFAIEMANASTGADDINTTGGALNNTSGNWRFDNVTIAGTTAQNFTPGNLVILQAGDGINNYANQEPVFLNEVNPNGTTGNPVTSVQQIAIPATAGTGAVAITSATETGTTVTVTTANPALFANGESITISGIVSGTTSPSAWDGTVPITVIDSGHFTFTAAASLPAITSLTAALATPPNQPLTIDITGATGNGQLDRSYDGSSLSFAGIDSTVNDGGTGSPSGPAGTFNKDLAVVTGNPNIPSDINTATYGQWNTGDDTRGAVVESATGPIYEFGHQNKNGALFAGVHAFNTEGGPSTGTQVTAGVASNVRGAIIGFDNRMYFSSAAGLTSVNAFGTANGAGIFTEAAALPTQTSATPTQDIEIVPSPETIGQLGGIYFADMNGTGIMSNGDRLYFVDNGTKGGAGTGGLYVSTWNTSNNFSWNTPNNAPAAAAGIQDYWGVPVRIGDAPTQAGQSSFGGLQGITGTVLNSTTVELFTSDFDAKANDSSIIQQWNDSSTGVTISEAQVQSGTTVKITTLQPNTFATGSYVSIDGVGTTSFVTGGYNGTWQITRVDANDFTFTDPNSGLGTVGNGTSGVGGADAAITSDLSQAATYQNFGIGINNSNAGQGYNNYTETFGGTIVQTLVGGPDAASGALASDANVGLRGLSFAPVAATSVVLSQGGGNLTATLANSQVTPSGLVTFINENTGTVLGTVNISGTAPYTATLPSSTVVGNAYVEAYFAGGGVDALASATSNVIQVQNAGTTSSSVTATATPAAVAVGTPVTLTATVTSGATGNVSFYNTTGSAPPSLANLIGTASVSGTTATLTTSFGAAGAQTITAIYNGDNVYNSNRNTTTVTVALNATAVITSSANNVALSSIQTYTATVTGNATLGTPAGSVVFNLVSADTTSGGVSAQTATSPSVTLIPGANNTATAIWTGPALAHAGSYFITMTYTPLTGSPYSAVAITTTSSLGSGAAETSLALIETVQQAFTPGNLVAVQRGDGSVPAGSSGYIVFLDEYTPSGTLVQSIALPNSVSGSNNPLLLGGQNPAEGLINRSTNGYDLTLAGYDVPVGQTFLTSTFPYQDPRTIAEINGSATINTSTVISATSPTPVPYDPTDVVSNDGKEFWLASTLPTGDTTDSGILYVGSVGATSATQIGAAGVASAAITIAGGQLYNTKGNGDVQAVGAGLPTTAGQTLTGLPNLAAAYASYFPTKRSPEQVLLLNTNDGTTNNPNVAYIADQIYGLLKFYLDTTSDANHGMWEYGSSGNDGNGVGIFGQKLVFAGGATGVSGYVVNPGASAQVQLYITGSNTQGTNANQIDSLLDTHGGVIGSGALAVDNGFPGANFSVRAFVGGGGTSPNGNENFAGLAFVPGYVTDTTLAQTGTSATGYTFTATVSTPSAPSNVPTGQVYFYLDGVLQTQVAGWTLNGSGKATFTIGAGLLTAGTPHTVTALYQGDVKDGISTGVMTWADPAFTAGNLIATLVGVQTASVSTIAEAGTTATVTTAAPHGFLVGQSVTLSGVSVTGYNTTYTIVTVPSPTTFTVTATASLGSATGGTAAISLTSTGSATFINEYATAGGASVQSIALPTSGTAPFTEGGTFTNEGYLTDSADGHTATLAGYEAAAGSTTSAVNREIGVINPNGTIDTSTQIAAVDTGSSVRATVSADGLGMWVATANYVRYVPFGNNSLTPTTAVTNWLQSPTTVDIGTDQNGIAGGLFFDGGAGAQSSAGIAAIDGPVQINGPGLPDVGGQSGTIYAFPTAADTSGKFPTSNQIVISPDGNTIFVADGRTDGNGGVLEFFQTTPGTWTELGHAQVDATADGGLRALTASFTYNIAGVATGVTLYGTTTNASANRIVQIAGGTLTGSTPAFTFVTVETALANTAFRGVAMAPTAPGATATTTTLTVTGSPGSYPGAVTLSAAVTAGSGTPTGYVSFRTAGGVEIGAAPLISGTATLTPTSDLQVAYSGPITAVYTGDATFTGSSNTKSASVTQDTTTTTLSAQFTSVQTGVADLLTAQVTYATDPPFANPTGTVTFWDGPVGTGTNLGTSNLTQTIVNVSSTPTIEFVATLSTTFTTLGAHNLSAVYSGDSNFGTSTGTQTVTAVLPSTTVVTTNNPNPTATPSVAVTETATVTGTSATPTGSVQFYDDLLPLGSPVALNGSGVATITLNTGLLQQANTLLPGDQSITAVYLGDTNYFTSKGVNEQAVQAKAFGAGDLFVERLGDGTTPLIAASGPYAGSASTGATIYVDEYTAASPAVLVQSIILPTADGTGSQNTIKAVVADAQQGPTGQLTLSGNDQYFYLTGYDSSIDPSNLAAAPKLHYVNSTPRAVARISLAGVVQSIGFTAGSSGVETAYNIAGVYSPDGNQFYLSGGYGSSQGTSGVEYFSGFAPSSALQSATSNVFYTANSTFLEGQGLENNGGNLVDADMPYNTGVATPVQLPGQFVGMPTAAPATSTITAIGVTTASNVYTVTITANNSFAVGQAVDITGVSVSSYNGVFNVVTQSATQFTYQVYNTGTLSLTPTLTSAKAAPGPLALPGLPGADAGSSPYDVYFTHEAGGPAGNNVMYITDSNGFANGTITKWSLVSGSWVLNDTIAAPSSTTFYWLAGTTANNGTVMLYPTFSNGGNGVTGPGYIFQISDTGGYNAAIPSHTTTVIAAVGSTGTLGSSTTANEVFKGVAVYLAPTVTTITSNNNPSTSGQNVAFTVTVNPGVSTPPNGDTVLLEDTSNGNAVIGSGTLTAGQVVINVSSLTVGTHNIVAVFSQDQAYQGSTSAPVSQGVNANSTTLSSVVIDANTTPLSTLSVSGNVVTATTLGNTTFAAGQPIWIDNSSVAADNGAFTILAGSSGTNTFTYTDNNAGAANATGGTATANAGTGSLDTGAVGASQRSMVDSIVYTFSSAVPAPTVGITVHAGQTGTVATVNVNSTDGGTTWVVTFSGSSVVGNSIADGVYDISMTDGSINRSDTFFRLFGDSNGDAAVTSRPDFQRFQAAFGSSAPSAAYVAYFDYNADGTIGSRPDFQNFQSRFGTSLSGFTSTI